MTFKHKSWIWWLTWPFAHPTSNMFTLIGNTLYIPRNHEISDSLIRHENIHVEQIKREGLLKYYFLYLFCLPLFYNPWRKKWELEAYINGSKITEQMALEKIRKVSYGWLLW